MRSHTSRQHITQDRKHKSRGPSPRPGPSTKKLCFQTVDDSSVQPGSTLAVSWGHWTSCVWDTESGRKHRHLTAIVTFDSYWKPQWGTVSHSLISAAGPDVARPHLSFECLYKYLCHGSNSMKAMDHAVKHLEASDHACSLAMSLVSSSKQLLHNGVIAAQWW